MRRSSHAGSMIVDSIIAAAITMIAITIAASVASPYFRARIDTELQDAMRRVCPVRISQSAGAR